MKIPISDLIDKLRQPRHLPRKTLQELMDRRKESAPILLYEYTEPMNVYESAIFDEDESPFFGMVLLAAMGEKRFFPLLIGLLRASEDEWDNFWGEFLFEAVPRMLAQTYNGDMALLLDTIRDESLEPRYRSIALECLGILHSWGLVSREFLVKELLAHKPEALPEQEKDRLLLVVMTGMTLDFQIQELKEWVEKEICPRDKHMADLEWVERAFGLTSEEAYKKYADDFHHQPITDAIALCEQWFVPTDQRHPKPSPASSMA